MRDQLLVMDVEGHGCTETESAIQNQVGKAIKVIVSKNKKDCLNLGS